MATAMLTNGYKSVARVHDQTIIYKLNVLYLEAGNVNAYDAIFVTGDLVASPVSWIPGIICKANTLYGFVNIIVCNMPKARLDTLLRLVAISVDGGVEHLLGNSRAPVSQQYF